MISLIDCHNAMADQHVVKIKIIDSKKPILVSNCIDNNQCRGAFNVSSLATESTIKMVALFKQKQAIFSFESNGNYLSISKSYYSFGQKNIFVSLNDFGITKFNIYLYSSLVDSESGIKNSLVLKKKNNCVANLEITISNK
jgi:hypothetical protein